MIRVTPWTPALHGKCISFLAAHKKISAGFLERACAFVTTGSADREHCFLLSDDSGNVSGAVLFLPNGLIFHCLPAIADSPFSGEAKALLLPLAASRAAFCVTGSLGGTRFLDGLYKTLGRHVMESRVFHLMEYESGQADCAEEPPAIIECTLKHEDALFPLRREYELIEVFPRGIEFHEAPCRDSLRRYLEERRVAGIPRDGGKAEFAAMAVVNAQTEGIAQIGGVYTIPEFRNRGYAAALSGFLARKAEREKKSCTLFVRIENTPAIRSYTRAGFFKNGHYGVTYYLR